MKNAPCTPLSPEEEAALLDVFPVSLTPDEEADAATRFKPYVFYRTLANGSRDCYCTSCKQYFHVPRKGNYKFFKASHKGTGKKDYMVPQPRMKAPCPKCGVESEVVAAGKFRNFVSLCEHEYVVRLSAWDGWLLAQAGIVVREFEHGDYGTVAERQSFHEFRRFAFKPGRRNEWQLHGTFDSNGYSYTVRIGAAEFLPKSSYIFGHYGVKAFMWTPCKSVGEAHYPACYPAVTFHILSPGAIAKSDMRYCQFFAWHDAEYGEITDGAKRHNYAHMCVYLSEYTRRPQMEMLVKLGYAEVVSDLVIRGKTNRKVLNWEADNPTDFFGMGKADFAAFRDSDLNFQNMNNFRKLHTSGLVKDVREYAGFYREFVTAFDAFGKACLAVGVTMRRAARYLAAYSFRTASSMPTCATLWKDYIDAAKSLRYDLTRDDVRMPKNLTERHDAATRAVSIEADEKAHTRYRAIYRNLCQRYEYGADGLRVVIPTCTADIVAEGKALSHCVGGYAARHMEGKTVILFLRKEAAPSVPYVTIETNADNNPAKIELRQIHGVRNDVGKASPREVHAAFLDKWLSWVHAGSPRDNAGRPIHPIQGRKLIEENY